MKKLIRIYGFFALSYLACIATGIWAIVEFVLYLVKNTAFNWNSIWCFCGSLFITTFLIAMVFLTGFSYIKK